MRFFLCLCLSGWLLAAALPAAAQQDPGCLNVLPPAQAALADADFTTAIRLLVPCATGVAPAEIYRLLSLAYLNNGQNEAARRTVVDLLLHHPTYTADPIQDPPSYTVLVLVVREQLQEQGRLTQPAPPRTPWYQKRGTWALVGTGLVVVGVTALFAGG